MLDGCNQQKLTILVQRFVTALVHYLHMLNCDFGTELQGTKRQIFGQFGGIHDQIQARTQLRFSLSGSRSVVGHVACISYCANAQANQTAQGMGRLFL